MASSTTTAPAAALAPFRRTRSRSRARNALLATMLRTAARRRASSARLASFRWRELRRARRVQWARLQICLLQHGSARRAQQDPLHLARVPARVHCVQEDSINPARNLLLASRAHPEHLHRQRALHFVKCAELGRMQQPMRPSRAPRVRLAPWRTHLEAEHAKTARLAPFMQALDWQLQHVLYVDLAFSQQRVLHRARRVLLAHFLPPTELPTSALHARLATSRTSQLPLPAKCALLVRFPWK